MTYFVQLSIPVSGGNWAGKSVLLFACTDCVDEDYLIPELLESGLRDAVVPAGFIEKCQTNFRLIVCSTDEAVIRTDYQERVVFQPLEQRSVSTQPMAAKIGGNPRWILDDESPSRLSSGDTFVFLGQLTNDKPWPIVDGAPPQMEPDYSQRGKASRPSSYREYSLFVDNTIYLFGVDSPGYHGVYVIVQSD